MIFEQKPEGTRCPNPKKCAMVSVSPFVSFPTRLYSSCHDGDEQENATLENMIKSDDPLKLDKLRTLLRFGYRIHQRIPNLDGMTLLHKAARDGDLECCQWLIDTGANVNSGYPYCHEYTPLYEAAIKNHADVAELLIDYGADVNIQNDFGTSPLHYACWGGSLDVVKLLIEQGKAVIDQENNNGMTPLMKASSSGYLHIVEYLLEKGADASRRDFRGEVASDYATIEDHHEIADLLKKHEDVNNAKKRDAILQQILEGYEEYLDDEQSKSTALAEKNDDDDDDDDDDDWLMKQQEDLSKLMDEFESMIESSLADEKQNNGSDVLSADKVKLMIELVDKMALKRARMMMMKQLRKKVLFTLDEEVV